MAGLVFGDSDGFISPLNSRYHGSSSATTQRRHNIPTPPNSTRPSLDSSDGLAEPRPGSDPCLKRPFREQPPQSPTPSPTPLSPRKELLTPSLPSVIDRVREVAEGHCAGCKIIGVTPELYKQLEAFAVNDGNLEGWEGLRVDYHDNLLTIGYPTSPGHEVLGDLFHKLAINGRSYPQDSYNGSRITQCGTADVPLTAGHKAPDFSLYEVKETSDIHDEGDDDDDNSIPTVVWEYAYSEDSAKLAKDSARHLLLSRGRVQLVVAVDVERKTRGDNRRKELTKVTWSHWELDMSKDHWREVSPSWVGELNEPEPEGDNDNNRVQPPANAYIAVVDMGEAKYHMRAAKFAEYELFPKPTTDKMHILYRHLYRDPEKDDAEKPAFTISCTDAMDVIKDHERIQRSRENTQKRGAPENASALASQLRRLTKKAKHRATDESQI